MTPSIAADFTYKEYAKAPEAWKSGFIFGVAQYLSTVAQPDEEPPYPVRNAYQQCLTGPSDVASLEDRVHRPPRLGNHRSVIVRIGR